MKNRILEINSRLENNQINADQARRELMSLFGHPTKYTVIEDHNNIKKGNVYKECYSTDGKHTRYYTTGHGSIITGDFAKHPDKFKEMFLMQVPDDPNPIFNWCDIHPGDVVECVKNDPMDDHDNIDVNLRWKIGDRITVDKVDKRAYGTFLYDNIGCNINENRVKLISRPI